MSGGSGWFVAAGLALGVPIALAAWRVLRRSHPARHSGSLYALAIESAGAAIGQALGLVLFALGVSYRATGDVEFLNGVLGYGTPLFSTWAGVGAWVFGTAFVGRAQHPKRALIVACLMAFGSVLTFFGAAAVFKFDGTGWMFVYALSPILGAVSGYRVGAFGMSLGSSQAEAKE
jgi:hypothetical protein